jgi:hypothetical protein
VNPTLAAFDQQFARLHEQALGLLAQVPADKLYYQPHERTGRAPVYSFGEYLLRSAAAVEQAFGGLTATLWDDPFEWTLPETLSTPDRVREYLNEVAETRRRGFAMLRADTDLAKKINTPGGLKTVAALLSETLARAFYYQGCAAATLPRLTIQG